MLLEWRMLIAILIIHRLHTYDERGYQKGGPRALVYGLGTDLVWYHPDQESAQEIIHVSVERTVRGVCTRASLFHLTDACRDRRCMAERIMQRRSPERGKDLGHFHEASGRQSMEVVPESKYDQLDRICGKHRSDQALSEVRVHGRETEREKATARRARRSLHD